MSIKNTVFVFQPYLFQVGQKIHIKSGSRRGDWEVMGMTERKVTLRCPVSFREFEWENFCYFVEEKEQEWPRKD